MYSVYEIWPQNNGADAFTEEVPMRQSRRPICAG